MSNSLVVRKAPSPNPVRKNESQVRLNYITDIDWAKALLLIDAAIQAYNSFSEDDPRKCQTANIKSPDGYEFVECWNGTDSVFSAGKTVEVYGVVFRSCLAPYTYIFAFRGTDSLLDVIDDTGAYFAPFVPFDKTASVDPGVLVEAGFWNVYTESETRAKSEVQRSRSAENSGFKHRL